MQDVNGDGLPNDEWYELKGSEYGKPETIQDYAVTYFRPVSIWIHHGRTTRGIRVRLTVLVTIIHKSLLPLVD